MINKDDINKVDKIDSEINANEGSSNENFDNESLDEHEFRGKYRKLSIAVVIIVLLLFLIVLYATGLVGEYLGKTAENIALVIVALILAVMLFKSKGDKK